MRLLLDMGVSVRVAQGLRADGHHVHHLDELELNELPDSSIFALAVAEGRTIATFDLDFSEIASFAPAPTASVLSLRLDDQSTLNVLARLRAAIEACGDALSAGAIVTVEQTRCRVRRYPIREA